MPSVPFLVYGTCTDEDSNVVASTLVKAHDVTTGERIETITNSLGQYIFDLANLTSGYTAGDTINIEVWNNGYAGESTNWTLSGEGGIEKNISTCNQVTLGTIRNTVWYAFYKSLQDGTFEISEDSIFSAMNDSLISSEGYPIVIIYPPKISKNGLTLENSQLNCDINFLIEIYHTSSENVKVLTDEVENKIWTAQKVWDGIGLFNLNMPDSDHDWWTEANKKIHRMSLNVNFTFEGVVTIP